jgi:hypothetical protein
MLTSSIASLSQDIMSLCNNNAAISGGAGGYNKNFVGYCRWLIVSLLVVGSQKVRIYSTGTDSIFNKKMLLVCCIGTES